MRKNGVVVGEAEVAGAGVEVAGVGVVDAGAGVVVAGAGVVPGAGVGLGMVIAVGDMAAGK
jgi:hypothetical protein